MVPSVGELSYEKSFQIYIIVSWALSKATPNTIIWPIPPISYKSLQCFITKDDRWRMIEDVFQKRAPHLCGKAEYLQKNIYYLRVISSEDLDSFIKNSVILHKNIILSRQNVSQNLLF